MEKLNIVSKNVPHLRKKSNSTKLDITSLHYKTYKSRTKSETQNVPIKKHRKTQTGNPTLKNIARSTAQISRAFASNLQNNTNHKINDVTTCLSKHNKQRVCIIAVELTDVMVEGRMGPARQEARHGDTLFADYHEHAPHTRHYHIIRATSASRTPPCSDECVCQSAADA